MSSCVGPAHTSANHEEKCAPCPRVSR
jgi:hypothetical protein